NGAKTLSSSGGPYNKRFNFSFEYFFIGWSGSNKPPVIIHLPCQPEGDNGLNLTAYSRNDLSKSTILCKSGTITSPKPLHSGQFPKELWLEKSVAVSIEGFPIRENKSLIIGVISIYVPTVERELPLTGFCSTTTTGLKFCIKLARGLSYFGI